MFYYLWVLTFFANSTRYTNLGLFWPILEWCQNEWLRMGHNITVLKNRSHKWIANLEKTIVIEFNIFFHSWNIVYIFVSVLAQFWLYDVKRIVEFPNFGKITEGNIFQLKKYTWFQVYNFLLLFGRDILIWNCFEEIRLNFERFS